MTEQEQKKFYQILGGCIREARVRAGLKQEAFAGFLQLSRASIVNIEKGRQHPPIHLLWVIAKILKVEVTGLLPNFDFSEKLNPKWEKLLSNKLPEEDPRKEKLRGFLEELQTLKS